MTRLKIVLILVFCLCVGFALSSRQEDATQGRVPKKKYNLSICAIFKNESNYLREWIEYHRLVGVDHFYLYTNNTTDSSREVLQPYISRKIVTLINWPDALKFSFLDQDEHNFIWPLSTQIPAYENAAKFTAIHETKWLVFLDIEEFLVPPQTNTLTEILEKYDDFPGVKLASDFFDSSKLEIPRRKLLIEAIELVGAPESNLHKEVVKTIFKPELTEGFTWPPYECQFRNNSTPIALKKSEMRINHYVNRGSLFKKRKERMHIDNRMLAEEELASLLSAGYEIEDQDRPIYRYVPVLLKKMGYEQGRDWSRK